MVIYEVNLALDLSIASAYMIWLRDHIHQILSIEGFIRAEVFEEKGSQDDARRVVVHYHLKDLHSLEAYFANHAEALRADAVERFGSRFSATRRVLERAMELTSAS